MTWAIPQESEVLIETCCFKILDVGHQQLHPVPQFEGKDWIQELVDEVS